MRKTAEKMENFEKSSDLAYRLMSEKDSSGKSYFSEKAVRGQLYGFLFAGHETTASLLQWVLYYLGENPSWSDKIALEFDSIGKFTKSIHG